jgi:hypothetical protein
VTRAALDIFVSIFFFFRWLWAGNVSIFSINRGNLQLLPVYAPYPGLEAASKRLQMWAYGVAGNNHEWMCFSSQFQALCAGHAWSASLWRLNKQHAVQHGNSHLDPKMHNAIWLTGSKSFEVEHLERLLYVAPDGVRLFGAWVLSVIRVDPFFDCRL